MTNLEILKSRTSLIKTLPTSKIIEVTQAMDAARKDEAVKFGDWILKDGWRLDLREHRSHTSEELYDNFKNKIQ